MTGNKFHPEIVERIVAVQSRSQVARPLKILVPLIQNELAAGDEAGLEHYRQAGAMLNEAKEQVPYGSWSRWLTKNFELSQNTAIRYMRLARKAETEDLKFTSRGETRSLYGVIGKQRGRAAWQNSIERIREETLSRQQERETERKLAMQLIDIGYKALASKLHPDKGGSRDAMSRLNQVRDRLKHHA
jgi:hypothetical protein